MDDQHRSCLDETVYRKVRPDERLRPFVECGWLRSGSSALSIRVMPDGCVDVFMTADGVVMIAGPANTFFDMPAGDHDVLAGLRLRPGAAAAVIGCRQANSQTCDFRSNRRLGSPALGSRTACWVRQPRGSG